MKLSYISVLTGALLTAAILGCVTESLPPYVENAPPVINGLEYAPNDSAGIRDTVAVTCLASDPNGDSMSFRWHCVEGRFIDTINANPIRWAAPDSFGVYQPWVEVYDRWWTKSEISACIHIVNAPPRINHLIASRGTAAGFDTVGVTADYSDRDDPLDSLTYVWSAQFGALVNPSNTHVSWIAPDELGVYHIALAVADKLNAPTRDSVKVIVAATGSFNNPPAIERVYAAEPRLAVNDRTRVGCDAYDPDDDPLVYLWSCLKGTITGSGPRVEWQAPADTGICRINVEVSDGRARNYGFTTVQVAPDTVVYYQSDFTYDDVTDCWQVQNRLAGRGEDPGNYHASWDSTAGAMAITGMSAWYSTYGVLLQRNVFQEGTFKATVSATTTRWGLAGFIPKYNSERDYMLIGIDYSIGKWVVVRCINGVAMEVASDWKSFMVNEPHQFEYRQYNGHSVMMLDGVSVWDDEVEAPFGQATAIGVAAYGIDGTGKLLFDNVRVSRP